MALTVPWIVSPKAILYTDFGEIRLHTTSVSPLDVSTVKAQTVLPGTGLSTENKGAFPASAGNTPLVELSPGV